MMKSFLLLGLAATTASATQCEKQIGGRTFTRESVGPAGCDVPSSCAYQCSASYTTQGTPSFDDSWIDLTMTSTATPTAAGCTCDVLTADMLNKAPCDDIYNGTTSSNDGTKFVGTYKAGTGELTVVTTTSGVECTSVYSTGSQPVVSSSSTGGNASSSGGASSSSGGNASSSGGASSSSGGKASSSGGASSSSGGKTSSSGGASSSSGGKASSSGGASSSSGGKASSSGGASSSSGGKASSSSSGGAGPTKAPTHNKGSDSPTPQMGAASSLAASFLLALVAPVAAIYNM